MNVNELKAEIVRNGLTIEEFADSIGIGRTTLWRKFKNPDIFTLGEIDRMSSELNIDGVRLMEIFFTDKVS